MAAAQLEILDGFCGPEQAARRERCAVAHRDVGRLRAELEGLRELDAARERELDLLEHELAEIEQAAPREGETERLLADRERLRRLDALRAAAGLGSAGAGSRRPRSRRSGAAKLADAAARLDALAGVDPELDALAQRCRALAIEAQDLAGELRDYGERLDGEEGALQALEDRLATLERLTRKHGGTVAAVLEHADNARVRRERAARRGGRTGADHRAPGRRAGGPRRARWSAARRARAAAPRLADAVRGQLAALAMPDASFAVRSPRASPARRAATASSC